MIEALCGCGHTTRWHSHGTSACEATGCDCTRFREYQPEHEHERLQLLERAVDALEAIARELRR